MPPRVKVVVRRKVKKIPPPIAADATEKVEPRPATADESHIDFASLSADQQLAYEIALFGEAAENQIPAPVSAPAQVPNTCSKLIENRQIQAETNRRYEESLLADQRKTEAAKAAKAAEAAEIETARLELERNEEETGVNGIPSAQDIHNLAVVTLSELRRARIARFQNPVTAVCNS